MPISNTQVGSSAEIKWLREIVKRLERLIKSSSSGTITGTVEIDSSCQKPVFVEICNPSDNVDEELVFTDAIPICVSNEDGTKSTWYTRERIVWNSVTATVVSRTTEYSNDGATWSTTSPSTFTIGACIVDVGSLYENFTLQLTSGQSVVFPSNVLFEYSFAVAEGTASLVEGYGSILFEQGDSNKNGNVATNKKLIKPITITAGANSRVIVSGLIELNHNITII